jgi:hypothetical protein
MAKRQQQSEEQKQAAIREAKRDGKKPSETGASTSAQKQIAHETDPQHPKQKTTHPVRK